MGDNEIGNVVIVIRATADSVEQVAEEVKEKLKSIGTAADSTKAPMKEAGSTGKAAGKQMADGAKEANAAWLALAVVAVASLKKISTAVKQGITDANAYKDALKGLTSVADYVGVSQGEIEEATAKVTNEFFNAEAAATSLKNLLLRGYSLDQAVDTIQNLQDAAAYGRQASLTLSDAVKTATEGLKNENSILVDNAGVTKNVAKMWEDYAKQIGVSVSNMTQAQKVQAEYLGIQQETAAMTGDLASLQDTLSGKMAAAENQQYLLSVAYGDALTPLQAIGTEMKTNFLTGLTSIVETMPGVTAGTTTATASFIAMNIAIVGLQKGKKIIDDIKTAVAALNAATSVSYGTLSLITVGLGLAAAGYTAYKNHLEEVAKAEEERIQQNKDAVTAQEERVDSLETLIDRYVELKKKSGLTYSEAVELVSIEKELSGQYGLTTEKLETVTGATNDYTQAIKDLTQAEREKLLLSQEQVTKDAQDALYNTAYGLYETRNRDTSQMNGAQKAVAKNAAEEAEAEISALVTQYSEVLDTKLYEMELRAYKAGEEWNDTIASALADAFTSDLNLNDYADTDAMNQGLMQIAWAISDAASSPEMTAAIDDLQGIWDQVEAGDTEIDFSTMKKSISAIDALWDEFGSQLGITKEEFVSSISPINYLTGSIDDLTESLTAKAKANREAKSFTTDTGTASDEAKESYADLTESVNEYNAALEKQKDTAANIQKWREMEEQLNALKDSYTDTAEAAEESPLDGKQLGGTTIGLAGWQNLSNKMGDVDDETQTLLDNMKAVALELGIGFDGTAEDLERTSEAINGVATDYSNTTDDIEATRKELQAKIKAMYDEAETDTDKLNLMNMFLAIDDSESDTQALDVFGDFFNAYKDRFEEGLEEAKNDIEDNLGDWSDDIADSLSLAMLYSLNNLGIDDPELGASIADALITAISEAASDENTAAAMDVINEFNEKVMGGVMPEDEEIEAFTDAWETMLGDDSPIIEGLEGLVESGEITAEQMEEFRETIESLYDPLGLLGDTAEDTAGRVADAASAYSTASKELSSAEKTIKNARGEIEGLTSTLSAQQNVLQKLTGWDEVYSDLKKATKGSEEFKKALKDAKPYAEAVNFALEEGGENIDDLDTSIQSYRDDALTSLNSVLSTLQSYNNQLVTIASNDDISGSIRVDASQASTEVQTVIALVLTLLSLLSEADIDPVGVGGGSTSTPTYSGGGGGYSESAYEKALDELEHLKALDQLTYEQELAHLEEIAETVRMNAEEEMDLEERIYELKKEIAARDAENLTDLTEAIEDALEERYDAMKEKELDALETSRSAWEEWRDSNVQAIQDQIDALDALEEAEDRESDTEEALRKIAKLEQSVAYEQDDYNKAQLQKQLDAAQEAYEELLADYAREDQISALEDAIDTINDTADSEIAALDEQEEAIEAYYEERMDAANLQAEAELELVNSTQQEIIDLLAEYAPDYDAAGRTLGEKLMDGFEATIGDFSDWFDRLTANMTATVDQIAADTVASVSQRSQAYDAEGNPVSGITIEQTNNFNTPVETPAETARRIQQANEDLAEQIAGE